MKSQSFQIKKVRTLAIIATLVTSALMFQNCGSGFESKSKITSIQNLASSQDLQAAADNEVLEKIQNIVEELIPGADPDFIKRLFAQYKSGKTLEQIRTSFINSSEAQAILQDISCNYLGVCNNAALQTAVTNFLLRFPISQLKDLDKEEVLTLFKAKFVTLFGRQPTSSEIATWRSVLQNQPLPEVLAQLVSALHTQLDGLYMAILQRHATTNDFTRAIIHFANGGTLAQLSEALTLQAATSTPTNQSCAFNGQTISHGQSVTAYQAATTNSSSTPCASQTRTCNNGSLSGTYLFATCTAPAPLTADQTACNQLGGHLVAVPNNYAIIQNGNWGSYGNLCGAKSVLGGVYCPADVKNGKTFQSVAESGINIAPFVNLYGPGSCNDSLANSANAIHRMLKWASVCCGN